MTQTIISQIDNLALLWIVLIVSIAATGLFRVYKLHPNWATTRHQIATEKFDRLYESYKKYRSPTEDPHERSANTFRFEEDLKGYCKTPVHHRVGDMAFKAESPSEAFYDLRKLPKTITYKDGVFRQTRKPYTFPSKKAYSRWQMAGVACYIISSVAIGGPLIAFFLEYLSFPAAILASISLGYIPGLMFVECIRARNKADRLYRIGTIIRKHGGRLYGEYSPVN
ncbi:hypothetical protein A8U91_00483 [Halomonas elongata]|uniref:Uncharacterized protein n=1 Tax=Halomonas elongata TaxID=2746 RepID=A0A1B8P1J9_HALEL|nr:hypothetical protein A8U91_00483 [Halomonas elongata]